MVFCLCQHGRLLYLEPMRKIQLSLYACCSMRSVAGPVVNTNDDSRCIGQNLIPVMSYILVPEVLGNACALVCGLRKSARKI